MYAHFIQKDLPDTVVDFNAAPDLKNTPPIIAGNNNSVMVGTGSVRAALQGLSPGSEARSFSIEAWIAPLSNDEVHAFDGGGYSIWWADGAIHFAVLEETISYKPEVMKAFHVVGTVNREHASLFVDGRQVGTLELGAQPKNIVPANSASSLVENWSTRDEGKWTFGSGEVRDGYFASPGIADYSGSFASVKWFDLTGGQVALEVIPDTSPNFNTYIVLYTDNANGNAVVMDVNNNHLNFEYRVGGANTLIRWMDYDEVAHRFWRIHESAGVIYWSTSPDGLTWILQESWTPTWPVVSMRFAGGTGGLEETDSFSYFGPVNMTGSSVIGSGSGRAVVDGVAFYNRELQAQTIQDHYLLGTTIPAITTNLSSLSAVVYSFENQAQHLISRSVWPDWSLGSGSGIEIVDNSIYSETAGTWQTIIPLADYQVIQRGQVEWASEGTVTVEVSKDAGATWTPVANRSYIPGVEGTSPMTLDIKVTLGAESTLHSLEVELYDSLEYDVGLLGSTAKFNNGDVSLAPQPFNQIEYREDRGASITVDSDITIIPPADTPPLYAIDMWIRGTATAGWFWIGDDNGKGAGPGWVAQGTVYINGASSYTYEDGEWIHVLFKLNTPMNSQMWIGLGLDGQVGSATLFYEDITGQEDRIYRSYFGGQKMNVDETEGIEVGQLIEDWDLHSYTWTTVGS